MEFNFTQISQRENEDTKSNLLWWSNHSTVILHNRLPLLRESLFNSFHLPKILVRHWWKKDSHGVVHQQDDLQSKLIQTRTREVHPLWSSAFALLRITISSDFVKVLQSNHPMHRVEHVCRNRHNIAWWMERCFVLCKVVLWSQHCNNAIHILVEWHPDRVGQLPFSDAEEEMKMVPVQWVCDTLDGFIQGESMQSLSLW